MLDDQSRLALAIQSAGLGVWDRDLLAGDFTLSESAAAMLGLASANAHSADAIRACIHPSDLHGLREMVRDSTDPHRRARHSHRFRILRADTGDLRWIQAHGQVVFAEVNGAPVAIRAIGTIQDVTQSANIQAALEDSESRLRLALESERLALWEHDTATDVTTLTPEIAALFGFSTDQAPSLADIRAQIAPGERERLMRQGVARLQAGARQLSCEFTIMRSDGAERHLALRAQRGPGGTRLIGVLSDITDRKAAENLFHEMTDDAPVMIWVTGDTNNCTYMSRSWYDLTGQAPGEALGDGWLDYVHPEDRDAILSISLNATYRVEPYTLEYRVRRRDGAWRWLLDTARPRRDPLGAYVGHIGSLIDITERRIAEERRGSLVRELNHRVKNTLATVQAMVSQSLRGIDLPPSVRRGLEARLTSMANAHDLLTQTEWEGAEIAAIVCQAVRPFVEGDGNRIQRSGPSLWLSPKAALALAMVLHELATNATKYGALSNDGGRVSVSWSIVAGTFSFDWLEEGGPPVMEPSRRGLGSRLISRSLTDVLGGETTVEYRPEGLAWRVRSPHPTAPVAHVTQGLAAGEK